MAAEQHSFPIVGIGASAGGLAALREFLRFLPDDAGMAYVVVQHLDPKHESMLPDLLSCQNVLIYLGLAAQKKVIQTFHYALAPHGVLLLGPSETIGIAVDLFALVGEHKQQWYRKKASSVPPLLAGGVPRSRRGTAPEPSEEGNPMVYEEEKKQAFDLQKETDRLLAHFAPASAVIDAQMEILHFRGNTDPYLGPAPSWPCESQPFQDGPCGPGTAHCHFQSPQERTASENSGGPHTRSWRPA